MLLDFCLLSFKNDYGTFIGQNSEEEQYFFHLFLFKENKKGLKLTEPRADQKLSRPAEPEPDPAGPWSEVRSHKHPQPLIGRIRSKLFSSLMSDLL